jgi:hypothetical protein
MNTDFAEIIERIVIFCLFGAATVLILSSPIGYDFMGDRNVIDSPTWVTPPVWSELSFGVVALAFGGYLLRNLREKAN